MKNNVVTEKTEYSCSGCGACACVCPTGAVFYEVGDEGFFSVKVDADKCVSCGKCLTVCGRFEESIGGENLNNAELYALQSKDKNILFKSSSGGVAHEISLFAIKNGYTVCGVIYDGENNYAKHVEVSAEEGLKALRGTKYLQSDPSVFAEIIKGLEKDASKKTVFFGTPCQIFGLKKALKSVGAEDRALFIEIFCHGVPSYTVWREELEIAKKKLGEYPEEVKFRYKKYGWHEYCLKLSAKDKTYIGRRGKDFFYDAFFEDMLLMDSCYNCRMRKENSAADIRIGDYWGGKFALRSDGVSAVFAATDKGNLFLRDAIGDDRLEVLEADGKEKTLAAQSPKDKGGFELHKAAIKILKEKGVKAAVKYYRKRQGVKVKLKRVLMRFAARLPVKLKLKLQKKG